LNQRISAVLNTFLERIKQVIFGGIEAGEIRESVDADMAAVAFFGMLQGVVTIWALNGSPPTLETEGESMSHIYLEGIKRGGCQE
jgi:hypothetical protein